MPPKCMFKRLKIDMTQRQPLPVEKLYRICEPTLLGFETTDELQERSENIRQTRALESVKFGIGMQTDGYNIYVLGTTGAGKFTFIKQFLEKHVAQQTTPSDWCYLNNFADPIRPHALQLPAGKGSQLKQNLNELIDALLHAIPATFESTTYQSQLKALEDKLLNREEEAINVLRQQALKQQIDLVHTPTEFILAPLHGEKIIAPEEYEKLPRELREKTEKRIAELESRLQAILQQVPKWRQETQQQIKQLNRETILLATGYLIDQLKTNYRDIPDIQDYLEQIQDDIIKNIEGIKLKNQSESFGKNKEEIKERFLRRYNINLLIDNSQCQGAPIVYLDNPTHDNLLGSIEHLSQMGTLVTDYMLIKAGALHRANGGYLIIDVQNILSQPQAWEALTRTLSTHRIRIETLGQMLGLIHTVTLEPEQIPLDIKVVLLGSPQVYYLLCEYDKDFSTLFKVAADFDDQIERTDDSVIEYVKVINNVIKRDQLCPFHCSAVARIIEHSSRLVEDSEKLAAHMGDLIDLIREAEYWAKQREHKIVEAVDVQKAIDQQIFRANRIHTEIKEAILRNAVLIRTEDYQIGQVNGLSVIELGNFLFGQPSRITATARLGDGKVLDIEHESELGGEIHSKAVLILSHYLSSHYVKHRPLSLSASVVFEQSYGDVEGDSASIPELCALLSAIGNIPVKQSIAVTGSVDQYGQVQVIGAVNEKIEGFFDICQARGLNGKQGVIIPCANEQHLMLRQDIIDAAKQNLFHVYTINTIDEAMELLTDLPAGSRNDNDCFPEHTINHKIEAQLILFADIAQSHPDQTMAGEIDHQEENEHKQKSDSDPDQPTLIFRLWNRALSIFSRN